MTPFDCTRTVAIFNGSAPGANTAVFTKRQIGLRNGKLRIAIQLSTSSVVNLVLDDGTTTHKGKLNDGTALDAEELYVFEAPVPDEAGTGSAIPGATISYTIEYETDSVTEVLTIDELSALN